MIRFFSSPGEFDQCSAFQYDMIMNGWSFPYDPHDRTCTRLIVFALDFLAWSLDLGIMTFLRQLCDS
jgi:hypothetical protein